MSLVVILAALIPRDFCFLTILDRLLRGARRRVILRFTGILTVNNDHVDMRVRRFLLRLQALIVDLARRRRLLIRAATEHFFVYFFYLIIFLNFLEFR